MWLKVEDQELEKMSEKNKKWEYACKENIIRFYDWRVLISFLHGHISQLHAVSKIYLVVGIERSQMQLNSTMNRGQKKKRKKFPQWQDTKVIVKSSRGVGLNRQSTNGLL